MREPVHFNHTPCLALECGYSPAAALELAMFDQLTDVATPHFCRQKKGRFPDQCDVIPLVTQVDEAYGFWSLVGDDWDPAWVTATHRWHFGGGPGVYCIAEYKQALMGVHLNRTCPPILGRYIHLAQDYASHRGYAGFPTEANRHMGDSRNLLSKAWKKAWSSDNLLGHVLRPDIDDLAVSRASIIAVSHDIRKALWRRPESMPETSEAVGLLAVAKDDKDLVRMCRNRWKWETGKAMPDFRPPSPRSEDWRRWCA